MKTKFQKTKDLETAKRKIGESMTIVVADFTGLSVNSLNTLRKSLKNAGIGFAVIKKRLLKIAFSEIGIKADPKKFEGQTGVVFSSKDIPETSQIIYKFAKQNKNKFKILGGVEVEEKNFLDGSEVEYIGRLPGREVLLGQLVGMIAALLKSFLFILNEKSKVE
jgi:large subunit ribosomal protein L10